MGVRERTWQLLEAGDRQNPVSRIVDRSIETLIVLGRLLGSVVAVLGIGLFALPAGLLGSGFVEEIQKRKRPPVCPHCGKRIDRR